MPGREREFEAQMGWSKQSLNPWTQTSGAEMETEVPWVYPKCSPTGPSRRHGYPSSLRESHSLTHVARRPSDRARKHRSGSQGLEDACEEAPTKSSRTGQQQQRRRRRGQQQQQSCQCNPAAWGDSSPQYPGEAFSPHSVGTSLIEKTQTGDRWAVPVCRHAGLWSPSSVLTDKSLAHSLEFRKQSTCACAQKRGSGDRIESLGNQYCQPSVPYKETSSQHSQVLKSKLDEAVISSRDQKIVALVLSRLKKAQKMRELQQQAAIAWEELKRSDQKVHLTLERERRLLLQQSQEQWQGQKEQHRPWRGHEQPHQGHEQSGPRRDYQAKNAVQSESKTGWTFQADNPENPDMDKLDREHVQAEHLKQCPAQRLWEEERVTQSLWDQNRLQDQNKLQLQKRQEAACQKRQQHVAGNQKNVQESNLSSVVNFQARKVLMDCQAKAEELLRKLSLEQSVQHYQDIQEGLVQERRQEQQRKAQKEAEQFQRVRWPAEEAEERRRHQVNKRVLAELAEQKLRQARSHAHRTTKDRAQHLQELSSLCERNPHILKVKAEKEEKCHIEGIKEAIKKKEQRVRQVTRGKDPIFYEYQKAPPASQTNRCFDQVTAEASLPLHLQSGVF